MTQFKQTHTRTHTYLQACVCVEAAKLRATTSGYDYCEMQKQ